MMNSSNFSKPIDLRRIEIKDSFWKREMDLVREAVIPYQWDALNDKIEGALPSFCIRNFEIAAKITKLREEQGNDYKEIKYPTDVFETLPEDMDHLENRFYGYLFQDSDVYKWIEAVAYSLTQHPDKELEKIADKAIEIICSAQQSSGYLDTFYIINNMDNIFTNLQSNHELYCFGHLTEGAIAYYEATGKDMLLKAACRYADYIDTIFGKEDDKLKGYPGHEIAEMALARLYEVTNNQRYLTLGRYFIEERGKVPYYFDIEASNKVNDRDSLRYQYQQAHLPVREQKEAVGHAVRAVYLYSGMASIARITKDVGLYHACETLWNDITQKKMYITGGIGGTRVGEAFSYGYDLPNDSAYAETCASIGLVFFARRMLEIKADSKYADVMERALYNGILSGMDLDGKSFFYVNPLEVLPEACEKDERLSHVKPIRQKWFGCSCCPPNLARLISSIASYAFTETEDIVFVHLYMGSHIKKEIQGVKATIEIKSSFPWEGNVMLKVNTNHPINFTIALRIPNWCNEYVINVPNAKTKIEDGYYYITKEWNGQESIQLEFPFPIKRIETNALVRENIGKIAIMRGPIVYCLEEVDNGKNLHLITLPKDSILTVQTVTMFHQQISVIQGVGKKVIINHNESKELYNNEKEEMLEDINLTWVPYYSWANRNAGEMLVWIRK